MEKKVLAVLMAFAMAFMLASCRSGDGDEKQGTGSGDTTSKLTEVTDVPGDTETAAPVTHEITVSGLGIPASSDVMDKDFALNLLALSTGHLAEATAELFENAGFEVRTQRYYDKDATDVSHTAAYTVGLGYAEYFGDVRPVVLIAVRGTVAGEWYSNFDVVPSHSDSAVYAENFLAAAEQVFLGAQKTLSECDDPLIIVCGHSRGAACANLLGTMLDRVYPEHDVFVYTYATPATVRGSVGEAEYSNIFNFINPEDFVTCLPPSEWGFSRAGRDIILDSDPVAVSDISELIGEMVSVSPDVPSYYNDRHSLVSAGLSDRGMTTFELMSAIFAGSFSGGSGTGSASAMISPESDLYAVVSAFSKIAGTGFDNHMPSVYAEKIKSIPVFDISHT